MIELTKPLASGATNRTLDACPVCGKHYADNDHRFAVLSAGALKRESAHSASMSEELSGFLHLHWHDHAEGCASVDVIDNADYGQADLHACSFDCMRRLLTGWVDQLERNFEQQKAKGTWK
jgi:hypothetical protein